MTRLGGVWRIAAAAVAAFACCAAAQSPAWRDETVPGLAAASELKTRIEALQKVEKPTEEQQATLARLQQAVDLMGRAAAARQKAEEITALVAQAPSRLEAARQAQPPTAVAVAGDSTVEQLETQLKVAQAEQAAAREALAKLDTQGSTLADRRRALPDELAAARTRLSEADRDAQGPAPAAGADDSVRQLALARVAERRAALALLETELAGLDSRGDLLKSEREAASARATAAEDAVRTLTAALDARRQAAAREAERSARDRAQETATDPALKRVVAENAEYARRLREATDLASSLNGRVTLLEGELARVRRNFNSDQERAKVVGFSGTLGDLLRRQRSSLPSRRELQASLRKLEADRAKVDLERIEITESLERLPRLITETAGREQGERLRALLEEQRDTDLKPLQSALDAASGSFDRLEILTRELAGVVDSYHGFIDQRILWTRSTAPLWNMVGSNASTQLRNLRDILADAASRTAVVTQLGIEPLPAVLGAVSAAALFVLRGRFRRRLEALGVEAARGRSGIRATAAAAVLTLLLALGVPLFLLGLSLSLSPNDVGSPLVAALAEALRRLVSWVLLLSLLRRLTRRHGLGTDHFHWRADSLKVVHDTAILLLWTTAPLFLVASVTASLGDVVGGRLVTDILMVPGSVLLLVGVWRVFNPRRGVLAAHLARHPSGWLSQLRWLWFGALVAMPAASAILAISGWSYTATVLLARMVETYQLVLITACGHAFLLRGLEFAARDLARRHRLSEAASPEDSAAQVQDVARRLELAASSRQSRNLIASASFLVVAVGMWFIWLETLPALRVMGDVVLWSRDGQPTLTLANLFATAATLAVTWVASRNLPGALELAVLRHTPLTPSARYATLAVLRYVLVATGLALAAATMGLQWNNIQWLVAALSVGIGFGLQEIFANLGAGLILLFEQPVRVGDVVTVGDRSGQVVRIRMRATTIRDGEGRDLILPNKALITERVINWTLPEAPLRVAVAVSLQYGTNLAAAERALLSAASMPEVLAAPAPAAQVVGFGANGVDFEVRVFVSGVEAMAPVRHSLLQRIERSLAEAGITVAAPRLQVQVEPSAEGDSEPASLGGHGMRS